MAKPVYLADIRPDPLTVLTVGTFDGVHEGHKVLIRKVVDKARSIGGRALAVTFDPHPREIIQPGSGGIRLLTDVHERAELLGALGIDDMVIIPFTRDFSLVEFDVFVRDYLYARMGIHTFVTGYDHHFGRDRKGGAEALQTLADTLGFRLEIVDRQEIEATTISSTAVRKALEEQGDVETAGRFLGRPYRLSGLVVHGDKRGRTIGFPTANLRIEDTRKAIPLNGVYKVRVDADGKSWPGMMNIGTRPTFSEAMGRTLETHLIGFDGDLYGRRLTLHFLRRVREERTFSGVEALRAQLEEDRKVCSLPD